MRRFNLSNLIRPATIVGLLLPALALTMAACFKPSLPEVAFRCGPNDECPDDYECRSDGCCHKVGSPDVPAPECMPAEDGAVEAGIDAEPQDGDVIDAEPTDAEVDGTVTLSLASLTPSPGTVTEGQNVDYTVTLTGPAPTGGAQVTLSSDATTIATVPASVTVAEGQTSAGFQATGIAPGSATISATYSNTLQSLLTVAKNTGTAGELVITEFLAVSSGGGTTDEFVEIINVGSFTLDLEGWEITVDASGNTIQAADLLGGPVYLAPGGRAFGVPNPSNPANIPAGAAFVYGTAGAASELADTGSVLGIGDGTVSVDEVDFTSFVTDVALTPAANEFPGLVGLSTQLSEDATPCVTAAANNTAICWCVPPASTAGTANTPCSTLLINEVLIDATGVDDRLEFVELKGVPGANLEGFTVRSATPNGTLVGLDHTFAAGVRVPLNGFLVVGDNTGGGSLVANVDIETGMGLDNTGGGIQLLRPDNTLGDALGYGALAVLADLTDGLALVEVALTDSATPLAVDSSLARDATSTDTNDNDADFQLDSSPTPGTANDP